jgi:hypothetical protein
MKWSQIISLFGIAGLASCHAPVLLSELSPDSKPKEKYKYFNPDFQLPTNSQLKINGLYYSVGSPRQVPISYKNFMEAKKHGIAPSGFSLDELNIKSDTILTVVNTNVLIFYPNGTYVLTVYNNKSIEEIEIDAAKKFKDLKDGWYVYKLDNNILHYEYYSKMSGFNYAEGEVLENSVTFGNSKPYQFVKF